MRKSSKAEIQKLKNQLSQKSQLLVSQEKQINKLRSELGTLKSQSKMDEFETHSDYHNNDYKNWRYMVIRCKRVSSNKRNKRKTSLQKIKSALGQIPAEIIESDAVYYEETDDYENQATCEELQQKNETLKTERDTLVSSSFFNRRK